MTMGTSAGNCKNISSARLKPAANAGVDVVAEIVEGMPEASIEKRAEDNGADLVVVGHRHISRMRTWLEGSTSESLVRRCPVSVLVVPDGDVG